MSDVPEFGEGGAVVEKLDESGEKPPPQRRAVLGNETSKKLAIPCADPAGRPDDAAQRLETALRLVRNEQDRRHRPGAGKHGGPVQKPGICPIEAQIVGEEQLSAAADTPAVAEEAGAHSLAARCPAEDRRLDDEQACARSEIGVQAAGQAGAVEEDGLLRQPVEARALAERQLRGDLRLARAAR